MNNKQFHNIRDLHKIFAALNQVTDEKFEEWNSLTEDQLLHEVMVKTNGLFNPEYVRQLIKIT